jgi:hypothetical protein
MLKNTGQASIYEIFALKSDISDIIGLPPDTLNTLQELANAIGNDPNFFQYVRDQLDLNRNVVDSYDKKYINTLIEGYYTKLQIDSLLNNKLNSSIIDNYYTKTLTDNIFVKIIDWTNTNITINSQLNLKANITDLNNYYTQTTTNSILTNYYNKSFIDTKFNDYYTSADINSLLDTNYYDKVYTDLSYQIIYTNISYKADKTELDNFLYTNHYK